MKHKEQDCKQEVESAVITTVAVIVLLVFAGYLSYLSYNAISNAFEETHASHLFLEKLCDAPVARGYTVGNVKDGEVRNALYYACYEYRSR